MTKENIYFKNSKDSNYSKVNNFENKNQTKPFIILFISFIMIIAGLISIFSWIPTTTADETLISFIQERSDLNLSEEQIRDVFTMCGTIGIIISVFLIFGGILALKRKLWGIVVLCSIIGLFSIGILFISTGLSIIALILLILKKEEFQK